MESLVLLTAEEQQLRLDKVRAGMRRAGIDSALIAVNSNLYYLTGRVFSGYVFLGEDEAEPVYFVKRPVELAGERVYYIRKPENIPGIIEEQKLAGVGRCMALNLSRIPFLTAMRLTAAMGVEKAEDIDPVMSEARATKTEHELSLIRISGAKHERVYRRIPQLYVPGMSDVDLQIEIERLTRQEGCLGQFRVNGEDMELHMGNVLAGDNADAPSPYDFAMGGAGMSPSIPVGANGTKLRQGMTVMVDMNGNFTGYMTDMTRCFSIGDPGEQARKAHQVSIDIARECAAMGAPGVEAKELYQLAERMAQESGLGDYFMGHRQHAGFVGHGVGIEINERPVLAPRSRDVLAEGNVIAIEPKFVIPGVGAVGIENTYVVTATGMECMTRAPQELINLEK